MSVYKSFICGFLIFGVTPSQGFMRRKRQLSCDKTFLSVRDSIEKRASEKLIFSVDEAHRQTDRRTDGRERPRDIS